MRVDICDLPFTNCSAKNAGKLQALVPKKLFYMHCLCSLKAVRSDAGDSTIDTNKQTSSWQLANRMFMTEVKNA